MIRRVPAEPEDRILDLRLFIQAAAIVVVAIVVLAVVGLVTMAGPK